MVVPVVVAVKVALANPVAALVTVGAVTAGAWLGWRWVRCRSGQGAYWSWEWSTARPTSPAQTWRERLWDGQ